MKRLPFRLISFAQGTLSPVEGVGRWLFNLAAVVSLLLALLFAASWVRSYYAADVLECRLVDSLRPNQPIAMNGRAIAFTRGALVVERVHVEWRGYFAGHISGTGRWKWTIYPPSPITVAPFTSIPASAAGDSIQFAGISLVTFKRSGDVFEHSSRLVIPLWIISALCLVLPYARLRMWRSFRLSNAGLCYICDYDLRATPERCPECGTIPNASEARRP